MARSKTPYRLTRQWHAYYKARIPMVCEKCRKPLKVGDIVMPRYARHHTTGGGNVLYHVECARELNIVVDPIDVQ